MPERPAPKIRPHPRESASDASVRRARPASARSPAPAAGASPRPRLRQRQHRYAELHVTSNFTFLTGASHPEELVEEAVALGHHAIALTDCNSLAGIVRGHVAARGAGLPFLVGCRLALHLSRDDHAHRFSILLYPTSGASYGRLCRLLTLGKRRAPKGACHLSLHDLIAHQEDLLAILIPPSASRPGALDQTFIEILEGLKSSFDDDRLSLAASCPYGSDDRAHLARLAALAAHVGVPLVATNDVYYHEPKRRALQDVLTCIRHGCVLEGAGFRLFPHAERCLKPPEEMARLFAAHPRALERTIEIADRASSFDLDTLRYQYPDEVCPAGLTPMQHLVALTRTGAQQRYPDGVPAKVQTQIDHEFALIDELDYAPYFLTVHDLVTFARARDILCQGRGAAANSAVCYCLGITAVDPDRIDLLFERFISRARNEPPDIDIDFEHERREEVIQYIYTTYGRDRAALTAEVITYRGRSAVREVGKVFGLSLDCVDRLAKNIDWWSDRTGALARVPDIGLDPNDPTIRRVMELSEEILGFPRHLSQHVGGFVITRGPLCEMVPVENAAMPDRTVIEWDKDDIDAMGMLKVDVLGLGMLTCIRKAFDLINEARGEEESDGATKRRSDGGRKEEIEEGGCVLRESLAATRRGALSSSLPSSLSLSLSSIPPEDPAVYDMICEADTIGVFQIESRAQMTMLPRLRPRCFYDLVIEVAIVRPGPIHGDMVHPYLRRRNGEEPVTYPTEEVRRVLAKTLGVPLFQEQAMALAIVAAGFSTDEADQLRRAMAAWKRRGDQMDRFEVQFIRGMTERGYERLFAERCFRQLRGFSEYGFPESHAASFALIVYVSAWLKKHHPAAFAAALINSQPMGFYAPAQIVRDAQEHGVEVRPVDVNTSTWDCTLEETDEGCPPLPSPRGKGGLSDGATKRRSDEGREVHHAARKGISPLPLGEGGESAPADSTGEARRESLAATRRGALSVSDGATERRSDGGRKEGIEEGGCVLRESLAATRRGALSSSSLRLGMRLVKGLRRSEADAIARAARDHGPFDSIESLRRASGVSRATLRTLAAADAFRSMGLDRQAALWHVQGLQDESLPLFAPVPPPPAHPQPALPRVRPIKRVWHDYAATGLSLKAHPMSFLRAQLDERGVTPAGELKEIDRWPHGTPITVAGIALVRQRPATAAGLVFITLEDETGIANLIVRPPIYERDRAAARHAVIILARGVVERQGAVVHVMTAELQSLDEELSLLASRCRSFR